MQRQWKFKVNKTVRDDPKCWAVLCSRVHCFGIKLDSNESYEVIKFLDIYSKKYGSEQKLTLLNNVLNYCL